MPTTNCGFDDSQSGSRLLATYGPSLSVNIGFDPAYQPNPSAPPIPGIRNVEALVDTGADESCIDGLLAAELKLPIIDQRQVIGVTGIKSVNIHLAQIHVPALQFTQLGKFAAVDLAASGLRQKALIGRTFLRYYTLTYEGRTGIVTLSNDE